MTILLISSNAFRHVRSFSALSTTMPASSETIKVVVRSRPLNSKEKSESRKSIIEIHEEDKQVVIKDPQGELLMRVIQETDIK